jgi:carbon storage regulator
MLVLSRRVGQQIRIGNSVVVTLLRVERNKARIGVDAPLGIPILRQELLDFDKVGLSAKPSPLAGRGSVHDPAAPAPQNLAQAGAEAIRRAASPTPIRRMSGARFLWDNTAADVPF